MKSLIYGWILFFMALTAAAESRPDHREKWRQQLAKRAYTAECSATCATYANTLLGCSSNLTNYGSCYCGNDVINGLVSCVGCGVTSATSQAEITLAEYEINQFLSTCSALGYNNISITITARPTVSFPCTDSSTPAATAGAQTTSNPGSAVASSSGGGAASPTPTPTASNPFGLNPSDLSLVNSLLGALSTLTF